ncbi:MAG: SpoIID/LytB domain-containing protein [Bacillota bacterium]
MKKKVVILLLSMLVALTPLFTTGNVQAGSADNTVSVGLKYYTGNPTSVKVTVKGKYKISENPNVLLEEGYDYTVKYDSSGSITLYRGSKKLIASSSINTQPVKYGLDNYIRINGRAYLGDMSFKSESSKYVRPVNTLPMEDYLKGVVPGEMPPSWNVEALKAQAVAARTYALSKIDQTIDDTVSYQRYEGYSWWESKLTNSNQAVNQTKGHVLRSNGKLITTFYSSSNGGYTENNANLWGGQALSYLPAKKDSYDPVRLWDLDFNQQQIDISSLDLSKPESWWNTVRETDREVADNVKRWLKSNGFSNKEIKIVKFDHLSVNPQKTSGDRRISGNYQLKVFVKNENGSFRTTKDGKIELVTIGKSDIGISTLRYMFGTMAFKSHLVDYITLADGRYEIAGRGFGHGIGMSQYGAYAMGKAGKGYQEILDFYYPTTENDNYIYNTIQNIEGLNRYDTSAAIAEYGWSYADTVVIGRGDNPVDALTGSVLAKKENAPMLLTRTNEIPSEVKQSLDRYKPKKIYLLGGASAISADVEKQLKEKYTTNVIRISGSNRHDTSVKVAQHVNKPQHIIITSNKSDSPDALSIASYAGIKQMPILYTSQDKLEPAIKKYIQEEGVQKVTIIGGVSAVSSEVENEISSLAGTGNVDRIAGDNRYETSIEIVKSLDIDPRNLFFARGEEFIDALPGSVLAAAMEAPIILTGKDTVPDSVEQYINTTYSYIPVVHFLGGESAISKETRNRIISEIID